MKIANEQYLAQLDFHDNQLQEQAATEREWLKAQVGAAQIGLDHAHKTHMAAMAPPPMDPGAGGPLPKPPGPTTAPGPDTASPGSPVQSAGPFSPQSAHPELAGGAMHPSSPPQEAPVNQVEAEAVVQAVQQGNQQLAQALMQMGNMFISALDRLEQNMMASTQASQASHQTVISALTRKKRVVRGDDGKVVGVE